MGQWCKQGGTVGCNEATYTVINVVVIFIVLLYCCTEICLVLASCSTQSIMPLITSLLRENQQIILTYQQPYSTVKGHPHVLVCMQPDCITVKLVHLGFKPFAAGAIFSFSAYILNACFRTKDYLKPLKLYFIVSGRGSMETQRCIRISQGKVNKVFFFCSLCISVYPTQIQDLHRFSYRSLLLVL